MYLAFFGIAEKPFAITPDPRYLYLGRHHADALAHLVYGINEAGGFIQLTGEVGTGKTTTIRSLLARAPKNAEIALIINPRLSPLDFLQTICEELGIGVPDGAQESAKELIDLLNHYLLRAHAAGRRVVLIVDEAQNLSAEVLEQVRLLTNLETESQKLLQIILIGQPELRELLGRNDLRQLAQRITARFHLQPLAREDTIAYVRHRLRVAGASSEIFSRAALREVHRLSGGVPRVINIICDRALLGAYTEDQHQVSPALVRRAASEIFGERLAPAWLTPVIAAGLLLAVAVVGQPAVAAGAAAQAAAGTGGSSQRHARTGARTRAAAAPRQRWRSCWRRAARIPRRTSPSARCCGSGMRSTSRAPRIRARRRRRRACTARRCTARSRSCANSRVRSCSCLAAAAPPRSRPSSPASAPTPCSCRSARAASRSRSPSWNATGTATACCCGIRPRHRWRSCARACAARRCGRCARSCCRQLAPPPRPPRPARCTTPDCRGWWKTSSARIISTSTASPGWRRS